MLATSPPPPPHADNTRHSGRATVLVSELRQPWPQALHDIAVLLPKAGDRQKTPFRICASPAELPESIGPICSRSGPISARPQSQAWSISGLSMIFGAPHAMTSCRRSLAGSAHERIDAGRHAGCKASIWHRKRISIWARSAFGPPACEVEWNGISQTLQRRVMQVLVALAQARGSVVSQSDLVVRCWRGLSVSDDAICPLHQQAPQTRRGLSGCALRDRDHSRRRLSPHIIGPCRR